MLTSFRLCHLISGPLPAFLVHSRPELLDSGLLKRKISGFISERKVYLIFQTYYPVWMLIRRIRRIYTSVCVSGVEIKYTLVFIRAYAYKSENIRAYLIRYARSPRCNMSEPRAALHCCPPYLCALK